MIKQIVYFNKIKKPGIAGLFFVSFVLNRIVFLLDMSLELDNKRLSR